MKRRHVSAVVETLELRPHDRSGLLPAWTPVPPAGGWTPASAFEASLAYADAQDGLGSRRLLAKCAYRELLGAVPCLARASIEERLRGVDHFEKHFANAQPIADLDDPAPF